MAEVIVLEPTRSQFLGGHVDSRAREKSGFRIYVKDENGEWRQTETEENGLFALPAEDGTFELMICKAGWQAMKQLVTIDKTAERPILYYFVELD